MILNYFNKFILRISSLHIINSRVLLVAQIMLSVFFAPPIRSQEETKPVAKVGNQIITIEEFRNRYEFMPHLNYSSDNKDTLRKEFLYSLISEKLWALEGLEQRKDTLDKVKSSLRTLEKLFVKDELFRKEVESKILLTSEEISKGLLRIGRTLFIKFITTSDSSEIFGIYNHFSKFNSFDSILATRPENSISQQGPFQIKLGTLADEFAEDIIFNLKIGEISIPVLSNSKWFIFKLVDEETDQTLISDNETARNKTISILSERKRRALAGKFLDKILGGRTISADSGLFNSFADSLIQIIKSRIDETIIEQQNNIELTANDLQKFLVKFDKEKLNSTFVEFDSIKLSLKDFIYYLMYQKILFPSTKPNRMKYLLNSAVKQFIEDEVITQEGYKRELDKLDSVQKDLNIWKNFYLSEIMLQSFGDSVKVKEAEIDNYIAAKTKNNSEQTLINIIEIFTHQIDDMNTILDELNKGASFFELAKKYNQREYTKRSNGEWGYFLPALAGQIGKIASEMEVGQIYGPIKVDDGYSVFKLIDKKALSDSLMQITEDSRDYIRMKLSLNKVNEVINKYTARLALKYNVTIDEEILSTIELSELNMFTYRLIGFGGKIAAMPVTIPVYEWYNLLKEKTEIP